MERRKMISLFFLVIIILALIQYANHEQYRYAMELKETDSVDTQGYVVKEDVYLLKENHGYVVVYDSVGAVYEYTNIPIKELPADIQDEIRIGKEIKGIEKVYGFLENYSS